jgi:hypothetical protein
VPVIKYFLNFASKLALLFYVGLFRINRAKIFSNFL